MSHPSYFDVQAGRASPMSSAEAFAQRIADRKAQRIAMLGERQPESPAQVALFEQIGTALRQSVNKRVKARARTFLAPENRWQLDVLWRGLSEMDPHAGLATIASIAGLECNRRGLPAMNMRAAAIVFRLQRARERRTMFLLAAE